MKVNRFPIPWRQILLFLAAKVCSPTVSKVAPVYGTCISYDAKTLFKGSRKGHSVKVSLWYASLLNETRFRFILE